MRKKKRRRSEIIPFFYQRIVKNIPQSPNNLFWSLLIWLTSVIKLFNTFSSNWSKVNDIKGKSSSICSLQLRRCCSLVATFITSRLFILNNQSTNRIVIHRIISEKLKIISLYWNEFNISGDSFNIILLNYVEFRSSISKHLLITNWFLVSMIYACIIM